MEIELPEWVTREIVIAFLAGALFAWAVLTAPPENWTNRATKQKYLAFAFGIVALVAIIWWVAPAITITQALGIIAAIVFAALAVWWWRTHP